MNKNCGVLTPYDRFEESVLNSLEILGNSPVNKVQANNLPKVFTSLTSRIENNQDPTRMYLIQIDLSVGSGFFNLSWSPYEKEWVVLFGARPDEIITNHSTKNFYKNMAGPTNIRDVGTLHNYVQNFVNQGIVWSITLCIFDFTDFDGNVIVYEAIDHS